MSETVRLSKKHGEYDVGTEFTVFKAGPQTTIVDTDTGRRIILPNSKLEGTKGEVQQVVQLTELQFDVLKRIKKGDNLDDILDEYADYAKVTEEIAKKDILFIEKHASAGSRFVLVDNDGNPVAMPAEMSETERDILEARVDQLDVGRVAAD